MSTLPGPITFHGAPSEIEWRSAVRLIRSISNQPDPQNLSVFWILTALLGVGLSFTPSFRVVGVLAFLGSGVLWWRTRSTDARYWKRNPAVREERWGQFSDSGFDVSASGATTSHLWQRIIRFASNDSALVLEVAPGQFSVMTRSMFPDHGSWVAACDTASQALPRASRLFSNLPPGTSRAAAVLKGVAVLVAVLILIILIYVAA